MSTVTLIMFLVGLVGIIGTLIYLIVNVIRKRQNKKGLKILGGFIVLTILSIILKPSVENTQANKSTASNSAVTQKTETKEVKNDTNQGDNTTPTESKIKLTDNAIKLTTDTLKRDTLVKEVAITMPDNNGTINIAIQVNAATNKNKAKDLIDTAVRQLGSNSGGKALTKTYLGDIWEIYSGHIRIFSGEKDIILDGYITKGSNNVTY